MGGVGLSVEYNNVFNHRAFDSVAGQTVNLSMTKQSGQSGRWKKKPCIYNNVNLWETVKVSGLVTDVLHGYNLQYMA